MTGGAIPLSKTGPQRLGRQIPDGYGVVGLIRGEVGPWVSMGSGPGFAWVSARTLRALWLEGLPNVPRLPYPTNPWESSPETHSHTLTCT